MFKNWRAGDKFEIYLDNATKIHWTHKAVEEQVAYGTFRHGEVEVEAKIIQVKGNLVLKAV